MVHMNEHYIGTHSIILNTAESTSVESGSIDYLGHVVIRFQSSPDVSYVYHVELPTALKLLGDAAGSIGRFAAAIKAAATATWKIQDGKPTQLA